MAAEEILMQIRKEKHQQLNGGTYPLATPTLMNISSIFTNGLLTPTVVSLDPKELGISITLHGRVTALRKSGSITFIKLTDVSGSLQLIATKNILSNYPDFSLWDLGDIVEVSGPTCLSKTNELSLLILQWKVLTKSHRPPPEKFAGITDPELKYRKRYLDLMSSEESRARFIIRSLVMRGIRRFMDSEEFMEVETSTLSSIASGANAKPFITHHNALDTELRLRIAPELNLKRLLVGGYERVFEIGRSYRNEGIDTRHNPEFTMMESYQAYGNFQQLIDFTKHLLMSVDTYVDFVAQAQEYQHYKKWRDERLFTLEEFHVVPMHQATWEACLKAGVDIMSDMSGIIIADTNVPRLQIIDQLKLNRDFGLAKTDGERIAVLFEHVAEPFLTEDYRTADGKHSLPVFITEYPKVICPLARANDNNPEICDRFELFIEGRELANAFQELNDPDEQKLRFQQQAQSNQHDAMDYDGDYIEALEYGLPPCIGFGIGIDRFVMLLTNTSSIKDVILFPTLKPIK